jgi:hypothetical protein
MTMQDKIDLRTETRGALIIETYLSTDEHGRLDHLLDPDRYAGIDADERAKYESQDAERIDAYERGDWDLVGVCCDVRIVTDTRWAVPTIVGRASIWGVESDSDRSYFEELRRMMIADALHDARATYEALAQEIGRVLKAVPPADVDA